MIWIRCQEYTEDIRSEMGKIQKQTIENPDLQITMKIIFYLIFDFKTEEILKKINLNRKIKIIKMNLTEWFFLILELAHICLRCNVRPENRTRWIFTFCSSLKQ